MFDVDNFIDAQREADAFRLNVESLEREDSPRAGETYVAHVIAYGETPPSPEYRAGLYSIAIGHVADDARVTRLNIVAARDNLSLLAATSLAAKYSTTAMVELYDVAAGGWPFAQAAAGVVRRLTARLQ